MTRAGGAVQDSGGPGGWWRQRWQRPRDRRSSAGRFAAFVAAPALFFFLVGWLPVSAMLHVEVAPWLAGVVAAVLGESLEWWTRPFSGRPGR